MPKKSNPEKGLRTVSITFAGKSRTLKFGHTSKGNFEAEANQVLRAQGVVQAGEMIFHDGLMSSWLGNAKVLSVALKYALTNEDIPDIDAAIDSYIEEGGKVQDLVRAVITAYRYASDPSSVASLLRRWQISDNQQQIQEEVAKAGMDATEKDLREMRGKLEKLKADLKAIPTPGLPLSESPSSSSDSPPEN